MKKLLIILAILFVSVNLAYASTVEVQGDGVVMANAAKINFTGATLTYNGQDTVTVPINTSTVGEIYFTPMDLIASGPVVLSAATKPGYAGAYRQATVDWADGATTPCLFVHEVPSDYVSGGAYKLWVDESDSTTPNQVDFFVFVQTEGDPQVKTATDQTPVALAGTAGTPCVVTLSVATDFTSLAAGQRVIFGFNRDDTADGTGTLNFSLGKFYYTKS